MLERLMRIGLTCMGLLLLAGAARAQDVSGTGQRATELFRLEEGLATFEVRHSGTGPFSARLLDEQGVLVEVLAQADGAFEGSKAVRVPRTGRYLYDVSASGAWSIRLRGAPAGTTEAREAAPAGASMQATYDGMAAGRGVAAGPWMLTGLVGGVLLGPIGAGINVALATSRGVNVPPELVARAEAQGPAYRDRFLEAYRARVRSNRKTASIVGGATGSLIFAFAVLQVFNWDSSAGGTGPGGGGDLP